MRHTSLLGQPKPVPLLPSSMVFPALLGLLVPPAGLPQRLISRLTTAGARAVPLPAIAVRAHHHLASASVTAQQSSVVRGPAASPTDRRARCESGSKALYSSPAGLVPRGGSGLGLLHHIWARCRFFLSSGLSPNRLSASPDSKTNNRPQLLNDNYSCASHKGRCRQPHDRLIRFSTPIDDATQSHQTAS